jgi:hypothetical protein
MPTSETIAEAMKQVSLLDLESDNWIDSVLDERRPRKRAKPTEDELRKQLEEDFLTPSHAFSTEWLNKLQQYIIVSHVLGGFHWLISNLGDGRNLLITCP